MKRIVFKNKEKEVNFISSDEIQGYCKVYNLECVDHHKFEELLSRIDYDELYKCESYILKKK